MIHDLSTHDDEIMHGPHVTCPGLVRDARAGRGFEGRLEAAPWERTALHCKWARQGAVRIVESCLLPSRKLHAYSDTDRAR